ncbi:MAG: TIGR03564 family F420-dependent LLM class oxidoreductase [Ilumatobacteraceae bacterium]
MRIGIFAGDVTGHQPLEHHLDTIVQAERDGFDSVWLPSISGHDPMVVLALAGALTARIELGTAVMPTYPRHPYTLAQTAVSVQAATAGRFTLGVGPSHQRVIEGRFGMPFARPIAHTREYLTALTGLLRGGPVDIDGAELSVHGELLHPDRVGVPVVVAALGPQMLRLAGTLTDGTYTWMTGPVTLAQHTVPVLAAAAAEAGRPSPRVLAGAPVVVTDDPASGRARGGEIFSRYGGLPSYRAMLDREEWDTPTDAVIAGDEATVSTELARYAAAGVTDFCAVEFTEDPDERSRTRAVLIAAR